jgi:hypothetical protein
MAGKPVFLSKKFYISRINCPAGEEIIAFEDQNISLPARI